jgi:hypothetical protein
MLVSPSGNSHKRLSRLQRQQASDLFAGGGSQFLPGYGRYNLVALQPPGLGAGGAPHPYDDKCQGSEQARSQAGNQACTAD